MKESAPAARRSGGGAATAWYSDGGAAAARRSSEEGIDGGAQGGDRQGRVGRRSTERLVFFFGAGKRSGSIFFLSDVGVVCDEVLIIGRFWVVG